MSVSVGDIDMLVGVGAVVGAGVAGIAVQANAISATSASDMAVSNCMAVVYTIKAWSKLRPMPCLLLIVAVVIIGIIVSFCQVIVTT